MKSNVYLCTRQALNALCSPLIEELNGAAHAFDADENIGAIIVTGSDKAFAGEYAAFPSAFCSTCVCVPCDADALFVVLFPSFAAGADIKEMAEKEFVDAYKSNMFANWGDITKVSKPVSCPLLGQPCFPL